MERTEVLKIMAVLRGAYPQFYRGISRQEAEDTVALWWDIFRNDEYLLVAAAVKAVIESDENGYPPVPGKVKAKLRLITSEAEMTEAEAWGIVAKALRNSAYGSKEEFEKFPPVVKRIVGNPAQLREWGQMDSETVHSVVASNFQRSYKAISQQEREIKKLPPDVKRLVETLSCAKESEALPEIPKELPPKEPEEKPVPAPREKLAAALSRKTGRSREEVIAALRAKGEEKK